MRRACGWLAGIVALANGLVFPASACAEGGSLSVHGEATYRLEVPLDGGGWSPGELRLRGTASGSPIAGVWGTVSFDSDFPGYLPLVLATWQTRVGTLSAGDFDLQLAGTRLVKLNRQLRGARIELGPSQGGEGTARPHLLVWASRVRSLPWREVFQRRRYGDEPLPPGVGPAPESDESPYKIPMTHARIVEDSVAVRRNGLLLRPGLDFQLDVRPGETFLVLAESLEKGDRLEVTYRFVPGSAVALQGLQLQLETSEGSLFLYRLGGEEGAGATGAPSYYGVSWDLRLGPVELRLEHFQPDAPDFEPSAEAWRWAVKATLPLLSFERWYEQRGASFPAFDDLEAPRGSIDEEGIRLAVRPVNGWQVAFERRMRLEQDSQGDDLWTLQLPTRTDAREVRLQYHLTPAHVISVIHSAQRKVDTLLETILEDTTARGAEIRLSIGPVRVASGIEAGRFERWAVGGGTTQRLDLSVEPAAVGPFQWSLRRSQYVERPLYKYRAEDSATFDWRLRPAWHVGARVSSFQQAEGENPLSGQWRWSTSLRYAPSLGWQAGVGLDGQSAWGRGPTSAGATATLSGGYRGDRLTALLSVRTPVPSPSAPSSASAGSSASSGMPVVSASIATPYGNVHQADIQAVWRGTARPQLMGSYRYAPGGSPRFALRAEITPLLFQAGQDVVGIDIEWFPLRRWSLAIQWKQQPGEAEPADGGIVIDRTAKPGMTATIAIGYRF